MTELDTSIRKSFHKYFDPLYLKFLCNDPLDTKKIIELRNRAKKLSAVSDEFECVQQEIE